ncbi:hypothetical protein PHLGIDRAFT_432356 [Phlebiopsis gigantea 11061_1 CR5-6]|uniref:CNH domain-containing protein n=1 Tax=Phlebiopsis gigantea (strain 11061_1 CR5-6) TaxID=745531 RepID=A0A0C3S802_PHLG1|nr:hypothetical protein PHLGIDRAFT_432356 [Phlebiopsis gigantea 11061_1 CR5-6]
MTALSGADLPPYQLQCLLDIVSPEFSSSDPPVQLVCAQALGPEIYVGCSNGHLLRFTLHPDANSRSMEAYTLLSRQSVPNNKPIENMILVPSLSRALVHSDRQILVYTLPALDMIPLNVYKPIRNVISLAVDEWQLQHAAHRSPQQPGSVEFCVIKRQSVSIYHLREKPIYEKDIPLHVRIQLARRSGRYLCVVDNEYYNMIDLETASLLPILPISQAPPSEPGSDAPQTPPVKPFILVISDTEFLLLSWTGASTLGLFITGEGEPVRGTLEWSQHPISVCKFPPLSPAIRTHQCAMQRSTTRT